MGTKRHSTRRLDSISYREGILAVSDYRIQVFTLTEQCPFTFRGKAGRDNTGEFHYPRGVAIDNKGFFMVNHLVEESMNTF